MDYRRLGKTDLRVSVIGLGTEFIWHEPQEVVREVVHEALEHGVNYFDLWMPSPEIRDYFGQAVQGRRKQALIAGHLGSTLQDGQYFRTRDLRRSEEHIHDLLTRLQTDYLDVLMLHYIDDDADYRTVFESGAFYELALRLKREGKARYIGMSSHRVPAARQAVASGLIDVLMFPMNPAFDALSADLQLEAYWDVKSYPGQSERFALQPERKALYQLCEQQEVALVAMKPFAGGWLLNGKMKRFHLTPLQCLNYSLSQPGVCTVVPGCKDVTELRQALEFLDADAAAKDFSTLRQSYSDDFQGVCMYCNHCLPCPVKIDIAATTRLADSAQQGVTDAIRADYQALAVKASACRQCGSCMKRCPFGVGVIANMQRAVALFGS